MRIERFHETWNGSQTSAEGWLTAYTAYYNYHRPHQALENPSPIRALNQEGSIYQCLLAESGTSKTDTCIDIVCLLVLSNSINQPTSVTETSFEDAFGLVGNDTRLEIIQVLGDIRLREDPKYELSFSELRSLTDSDLDPGQLNYHLQQLVGNFVTKTSKKYSLCAEGLDLYRTLRARIFNRPDGRMTVDARFNCYYCQAQVKAEFTGRNTKVECLTCEHRYLTDYTPPSLWLFEEKTEAFEQFSKYIHHKLLKYARRICPTCGYRMGTELLQPDEVPGTDVERSKVYVHRSCDHCGDHFYLFTGVALLADHGLCSFCSDHGVNVFLTPYWELEFAVTDKHVNVRSTDPWSVALHVTYNDDTLKLVVDGDLNVVERKRLDAADDRNTSLLCGVKRGYHTIRSNEGHDNGILPANENCLLSLRRLRWPDEVRCSHCESADTTKDGTTSKGAQRYQCHTCDSRFNDLTGTTFAGHRLSLPEMFYIIRKMEETKNTAQIARQLDRSYQSILNFVHEIQDNCESNPEVNS